MAPITIFDTPPTPLRMNHAVIGYRNDRLKLSIGTRQAVTRAAMYHTSHRSVVNPLKNGCADRAAAVNVFTLLFVPKCRNIYGVYFFFLPSFSASYLTNPIYGMKKNIYINKKKIK